ncbi:eCIS core domain-containing protein [Streptomyces griseus]|uniref:eCIS core domain-containing protein n=1 Tax=Streptomyces griseus TaxID=1911 RepID=UPI003682A4DF
MHARNRAETHEAEEGRPPAGRPVDPVAPPLVALQRSVGNAAVVRMLRRAGHSETGAEHQQGDERDLRPAGHAVQRSTVQDVLRTPGRPLDQDTRTEMGRRLGADFSDVRIHTDAAARASAVEVGARAYTSGHHVVIGAGGDDEHTLAHELTHVIQQRRGPVDGTDDGTGLKVSDPSDRFERDAEANATRAMRRSLPSAARTEGRDEGEAADGVRTGVPVQRTSEEDRQAVAALAETARGRTEPWERETFTSHDPEIGAEQTGFHIAGVQAPTDKVTGEDAAWSAVDLEEKKKLLGEAMDLAFLEWSERYDPEHVYVFAAPEYYFSGRGTHFLSEDQAAGVDEWLAARLTGLPSNYLVVPGTVGRRRALGGPAADQARVDQRTGRELLKSQSQAEDNDYAQIMVEELEQVWEQGPDLDGSDDVTVFDNYAPVFQGGQGPRSYTKRFEAPRYGGAPDRSDEERKQGFFAIGKEKFTTTVKDVEVKLEICSDNTADSLRTEPYEGVHILVAANFGDAGGNKAAMHGDAFVVADAGHSQIFESDSPVPQLENIRDRRYHAFEKRTMTRKDAEATSRKGPVSLNFYRTAIRRPPE